MHVSLCCLAASLDDAMAVSIVSVFPRPITSASIPPVCVSVSMSVWTLFDISDRTWFVKILIDSHLVPTKSCKSRSVEWRISWFSLFKMNRTASSWWLILHLSVYSLQDVVHYCDRWQLTTSAVCVGLRLRGELPHCPHQVPLQQENQAHPPGFPAGACITPETLPWMLAL